MKLQVIVLIGPADGYGSEIVEQAALRGFYRVHTGDLIDGEIGVTGHGFFLEAGFGASDIEKIKRAGIGSEEDLQRLTMVQVWRLLNYSVGAGDIFGRIATYMHIEGIKFADGPATAIADGYADHRAQRPLHQLDSIDATVRRALCVNGVFAPELIIKLTDLDLCTTRGVNEPNVVALRVAAAAYQAEQKAEARRERQRVRRRTAK